MGVNGLWTVVQPCARPTNLATLNHKRLAVDASIWIYQFLKAVRNKEGNALRNSHIVGFFRRICKLLWHGILPVFVFDGGAPALKRATLLRRQRRREGRREDAVRTAGKLLAVQMQRAAVEEEERSRREQQQQQGGDDVSAREARLQEADAAGADDLVYQAEIGMSHTEKAQSRRFYKQDAYHLPELDGSIASMAKPDDPRIMSVEELDEYARQIHDGQYINLYDFSKIDFDGDFFKSLPPADRYNILNAARLRSRLRMGLSKEQLDDMFPDRMAFSRFQIERVKERNHLTQRLMFEVGMQGTDLTLAINARVAGEKDREYILVKNEGVEGGWALGVVSKEKDIGEAHKPIDVDAIQAHYQSKDDPDGDDDDDDDDDDDEDFEDVPIEGLNRLPKPTPSDLASWQAAQEIAERRQQSHDSHRAADDDEGDGEEDSLFVGGNTGEGRALLQKSAEERVSLDEEDDINRAIALSLRSQHGVDEAPGGGAASDEAPTQEPTWTQRAADASRPITGGSGSAIAHVVNNRAGAAVPRRREGGAAESDGEDDMYTALAKARKARAARLEHGDDGRLDHAFGGPLPFPRLDWTSSFAKRSAQRDGGHAVTGAPAATGATAATGTAAATGTSAREEGAGAGDEDVAGGGFEVEPGEQDGAQQSIPPWLADDSTDIRESLRRQHDAEREMNAEDRLEAEEARWRRRRREAGGRLIEIEDSSGEEGEGEGEVVEVVSETGGSDGEAGGSMRAADDEAGVSKGSGAEARVLKVSDAEASVSKKASDAEENVWTTASDTEASVSKKAPDAEAGVLKKASDTEASVLIKASDAEASVLTKASDAEASVLTKAYDAEASVLTKASDVEASQATLPEPIHNDAEASQATLPEPIHNDAEVSQATLSEPTHNDAEYPRSIDPQADRSAETRLPSASPEPEFEDVPTAISRAESPLLDEPLSGVEQKPSGPDDDDDDLFGDGEQEEYSEPEDEELMMQMAEEAEEHARFASQLNQKSAAQNREDYEKELRALRSQQKKDRRDADEVTQVMVGECQSLLRLFGIPYITAPMEAEAQCAELVRLGIVDGIVTDDSDTFLFGGTRVYKNMFNNKKFVECYLGGDIEKELSLSREQLISLAQLLGSDYTEGLPGVGPVTAVEILSEFPGRAGLEQFRDWWTAVQMQGRPREADAASAFRKKFRKSQATKLFLPAGFPDAAVRDAYWRPEVDGSAEPFQWGVPDLAGLRRFLMATIGWSQERTDEVLVPVIRDMNRRDAEGTQSNMTRFLGGGGGGGAGAGAREAFAPRLRARGSKRMAAAVDRLRANVGAAEAAAEAAEETAEEARGGDEGPRKRRRGGEREGDAAGEGGGGW